jgi:hypothetical protein
MNGAPPSGDYAFRHSHFIADVLEDERLSEVFAGGTKLSFVRLH